MTPSYAHALLAKLTLSEKPTLATLSARYVEDPVGFCSEILGVELWIRQREIVEAVRDNQRTSVRSGRKVGKSLSAAAVALWWFFTRERPYVVVSARTFAQVERLYLEIRRVLSHAKLRTLADGCEVNNSAHAGIKRAEDFAVLVGRTASDPVAMQGDSGANLLYVVDEASGVSDNILTAIEGNLAGAGKLLLIGNPTRCSGEFFRSHHEKQHFYKCIHINSAENPNAVQGCTIFPGLASRQWIAERADFGWSDAEIEIHVRGNFALNEQGRIFAQAVIDAGIGRHGTMVPSGRLWIGVDPAGPAGQGDSSVFCARRGNMVLGFLKLRGLTEQQHLRHLLDFIAEHRGDSKEVPVVVVDASGQPSKGVFDCIDAYSRENRSAFVTEPVFYSAKSDVEPNVYQNQRAWLPASAAIWLKGGGAIPNDALLRAELFEYEWFSDRKNRMFPTEKDDIRAALGRSPDTADAFMLSCYEPRRLANMIPAGMSDEDYIEAARGGSPGDYSRWPGDVVDQMHGGLQWPGDVVDQMRGT